MTGTIPTRAFAIIAALLISITAATYAGMTGGYDEAKQISSVLCLSCIKLNPITTINFTFNTADGALHQQWILDLLKEKPVFLHYRTDRCPGCDKMEPIVAQVESVYGEDLFFVHINLDHANESAVSSFNAYDSSHFKGVPMFTVLTLGYARGIVKPYYATGYGFLNKKTPEEGKIILEAMISDALRLYEQNKGSLG